MPNYDYTCSSCHHSEEILQKMSEAPLVTCPHCQKSTFKRKIGGGTGLQFQGTGFYLTDYPKKTAEASCPCGAESSCK